MSSSFYSSSGSSPDIYSSASDSASAASNSATQAAASLTEFKSLYMGSFQSAPTATQDGSLYYNEVTNLLYYWNGTAWTATNTSAANTDAIVEGSTNLYFTSERVDDRVNALLQAGSNVTLTYNDVANTLTIASTGGGGGANLAQSTTDDLAEGTTNKYFSGKTTSDLSEGTNLYFTNARATSAITGGHLDMGGNRVLFANMYSAEGNLPSASTYHGMFAHVHGTGKGYFAHGNAWHKLLDETSSTTGDLTEGSNLYYTDERVDDRVNALLTAGSNISLTYNDAANTLTIASTGGGGGSGSTTFTGLTDTPATLGTSGQMLAVNSGGTALEFVAAPSGGGSGSSTFTGLTDTPSTFTASKFLRANSGGTALEYATALTPSNLTVTNNAASGGGSVSYIPGANGATLSFIPPDLSSYIGLTDISLTAGGASGGGSLSYNNTTGAFTYAPADVSGFITGITGESLYSLSNVYTSSSPTDGQVLTWDNANSYWKPTTVSAGSGGIALTDLSAANGVAGNASLSYNNSTGQFVFTPPDLSGYATTSSLSSYATTASLSSYATTASLATVATSGAYGDLSGTPSLSGYLTDITGQSLYSLSNVHTSSSPTDGQVLTWDNANSYWKPTTVSSGSSFAGADYFKTNPALATAASATGSDAISVGRGGQGFGDYSTQIGSSGFITAAGNYATAYGWNANVSAVGGTALGTMAAIGANEDYSIALGYGATATAANQLMLGSTVSAYGLTSIQVGNTSYTPSNAMDLTTKSYVDTAVSGAGGGSLYSLSNVYTSSSPTDGQVLTWDNANSYWKPATASGGGGGVTGITLEANTTASSVGTNQYYAMAIGSSAHADGIASIAIGYQARTNASNAISIGHNAGYDGDDQQGIAIGLETVTNGQNNYPIAIGYKAECLGGGGIAIGSGYSSGSNHYFARASLNCVAIGMSTYTYGTSVAVGHQAWASGVGSTAIGRSTYCTGSNSTAIGQQAQSTSANKFVLGNSSVTDLRCQDTSISSVSDRRDKTQIETLAVGLDFVNGVEPKAFYKNNRNEYYVPAYTDEQLSDDPELVQSYTFDQADYEAATKKFQQREFGFVAQDVAAELPDEYSDARVSFAETDDLQGFDVQRFTMGDMTPILWKALRELSNKHDQLQSEYDALLARVVALENA